MDNLKDKKTDDILEKLVHINRITKVVKGGRRFGFSALVVVGNQAGKIGIAHAKAKQVPKDEYIAQPCSPQWRFAKPIALPAL